MIALIITNVILVIFLGIIGVASLVDMAKDSRPIVIKEAKALREYYEGRLKKLQKKTEEAEQKQAEYKGLYERELQKNGDVPSIRSKNFQLEGQVERLTNDLDLCNDRINEMAQENASLKEQIKALKKPAKKKEKKSGRSKE